MLFQKTVFFLLTFVVYFVSSSITRCQSNNSSSSNYDDDGDTRLTVGYFQTCIPHWIDTVRNLATWVWEGRQGREDRVYSKTCIQMTIHSMNARGWPEVGNMASRVNQCYCGLFAVGDDHNKKDTLTVLNQVINHIDQHGMPSTGYVQETTTTTTRMGQSKRTKLIGVAIYCREDPKSWIDDKLVHFKNNHESNGDDITFPGTQLYGSI